MAESPILFEPESFDAETLACAIEIYDRLL
jgi:hypothetical protein